MVIGLLVGTPRSRPSEGVAPSGGQAETAGVPCAHDGDRAAQSHRGVRGSWWRRPGAARCRRSGCAARCTAGPRSATICRSPGRRCSAALDGTSRRRHPPRHHVGHRRPPDRLEARTDDPAARRHGCAADARGHRPRLRLERGRVHARLRARHAHRHARRRRAVAERPPGRAGRHACCSCSSRARRATTAPGSCSTRACSTSGARRRHRLPGRTAYALHVTSMLPNGMLAARSGPMLAASDVLRITVSGAGGHASAPQHDPRPGARGLRDRRRTADDGDPADRRVRPRGRHHRQDLGRHDEQRDPRHRARRGHGPHVQRDDRVVRCTTASAASPRASPPPTR